jgi:predicted ATPase/class 3 adenylate cyclase
VRELPSGEVTFVVTDIEGSTRLLRKLGDEYEGVLTRHLELLRAAAEVEGGMEVDTEGDAIFLAFADAAAALRAALRAQRSLADEPWPPGVAVRVRIGVHTGAAAPSHGRYVALAVHQAARIAAAGHGGQIVLSEATLAATDDLTQGVLRDLGQHYLKDFDEPVRLWQLTAPGAPADFPALRTGDVRLPMEAATPPGLTGAPIQWTTFIGREAEKRVAIKALSEARLVVLLGPGGVGKTRLAAEIAGSLSSRYEHGGTFVELVPVRPGFLLQAVAAALGVTGRAGQPLDESVLEYLATRTALLIFDNCEHVLEEAAGFIARILMNCPQVAVLATSRARLGVPGERLVAVPPLTTVDDGDDTMPSEATRLFLDRARDADPDFDEDPSRIAELCTRLDGMPLAIELAAARAGSLGVAGLLAGLGDQLRLLAGGRSADERHRSLRSVLDWSHSLLSDDEQEFLHRLGIFVNGFDLRAAAEVALDGDEAAAADLLGRLADSSLVVRQRGAAPRWRLLETVRTYALDKLAGTGSVTDIRARHLEWAARSARQLESRLETDAGWHEAFDLVADDLRTAVTTEGDVETLYALAMANGRITFAYRFFDEARTHFERAAAVAPNPAAAIRAMAAAADVCQANVRTDAAFDRLLRAADIAASVGDDASRATCLAQAVIAASRFPAGLPEEIPSERLTELLDLAQRVAPADDARVDAYLKQAMAWRVSVHALSAERTRAEEALAAARAVDDPVLISAALDAVMAEVLTSGRMRTSFALAVERMATLAAMSRHDPRASIELTDTLHMLNENALAAGELPTALREMRKLQHDDVMVFVGFNAISKLLCGLVLTGEFGEAAQRADEMWGSWLTAGSPIARWMAPAVLAAALGAGLCGDDPAADEWVLRARRVVGDATLLTHRNSAGMATFAFARRAMHAGRLAEAAQLTRTYGANADPWYDVDKRWFYDAYVWALDAELAVLTGAADARARLDAARPAAAENRGAAACLSRARGRHQQERQLLEESIELWAAIDARFERAVTLLLLPDRAEEGRAELAAIGATVPA